MSLNTNVPLCTKRSNQSKISHLFNCTIPAFFYFNDVFFQAPTPQQREMMEEAAARIAQDNCELACCFIQKTAVEKAGPEMDKRLATVRL